MPFFQQKSHRYATNSGEHPAIMRELERLYRTKCDAVMGDIRFSALLAPNLPTFANQLSLLASTAIPTLAMLEKALQTQEFSPTAQQTRHNVPPLSKENAHSVALAYCNKRLQESDLEQQACVHLQRFARQKKTQELLATIQTRSGEERLFLQGLQKRFLCS